MHPDKADATFKLNLDKMQKRGRIVPSLYEIQKGTVMACSRNR